jgi:hypothetical protein
MENDIALIASGYLLARVGLLAGFGYLVYRILRRSPARMRVPSQSSYAIQRSRVKRYDR